MHTALLSEIDKLQLPHRFGETIEPGWVEELLADYDISADDLALDLANDVVRWQSGQKPSVLIEHVISVYLETFAVDSYSLTGEQYLALFERVQIGVKKNWRGVDWFTAKLLLSKARIIGYLQCEERYSASQVVKVLSATESSLQVPFQAVNMVGAAFGASVAPPSKEVIDLTWKNSLELGDALFADASVAESCDIAAQLAEEFTPSRSLRDDLLAFSGVLENTEPSWNYLQMLYWQALILEFYDHPATWLYEFAPRGANAKHAFQKFEVATDNPFLNNAKGTATLGHGWALNRGGDDAHALVKILAVLEEHPRSASVDTSRILRTWIVRTLALWLEERTLLEVKNPGTAYRRLVDVVCAGDTNTQGVIEQRVVDALCLLASAGDSWRPSGLGDHVNATNTARKKLGDVEFASAEHLRAIAVEAHGGRLSRAYVESHSHSLNRSIGHRLETAWANLAEAHEWAVDVIFVAHQFSNEELPLADVMHDVPITFRYFDYVELRERAEAHSDAHDWRTAFDRWVLDVLNSPNVRQTVREKAANIMGDAVRLV